MATNIKSKSIGEDDLKKWEDIDYSYFYIHDSIPVTSYGDSIQEYQLKPYSDEIIYTPIKKRKYGNFPTIEIHPPIKKRGNRKFRDASDPLMAHQLTDEEISEIEMERQAKLVKSGDIGNTKRRNTKKMDVGWDFNELTSPVTKWSYDDLTNVKEQWLTKNENEPARPATPEEYRNAITKDIKRKEKEIAIREEKLKEERAKLEEERTSFNKHKDNFLKYKKDFEEYKKKFEKMKEEAETREIKEDDDFTALE